VKKSVLIEQSPQNAHVQMIVNPIMGEFLVRKLNHSKDDLDSIKNLQNTAIWQMIINRAIYGGVEVNQANS
jgi:hypothetical protein